MAQKTVLDPARDAIDVGIVVNDVEKSIRFYRDILGLELETSFPMGLDGPGTIHFFRFGNSYVKLIAHERKVPEAKRQGWGHAGETGYRSFAMYVKNIQEAFRSFEEAGVKVSYPVTEMQGYFVGFIDDPDGNAIEILQAPTN